jgi:hypothetical protein
LITEAIPALKIHKLTQAQYDRERAAGNLDENAFYLTTDDNEVVAVDTDGDGNIALKKFVKASILNAEGVEF